MKLVRCCYLWICFQLSTFDLSFFVGITLSLMVVMMMMEEMLKFEMCPGNIIMMMMIMIGHFRSFLFFKIIIIFGFFVWIKNEMSPHFCSKWMTFSSEWLKKSEIYKEIGINFVDVLSNRIGQCDFHSTISLFGFFAGNNIVLWQILAGLVIGVIDVNKSFV